MKLFFDERCLNAQDLATVLSVWKEIADYTKKHTPRLSLYLDRHAVHGTFLGRFNTIKPDLRVLFAPMLFGSEFVCNWRSTAISADSICKLETEPDLVQDCAVCEVYEHRKAQDMIALFGHTPSSFVGRPTVAVEKLSPPEPAFAVSCGTSLADLTRIGREWNCLLFSYDQAQKWPPRDHETVLGHEPERFMRTGRVERNGRRSVYRELSTNRFLYVDNLHFGAAAHLEVFDSDEMHLGTADLNGVINSSTRINGRRILW